MCAGVYGWGHVWVWGAEDVYVCRALCEYGGLCVFVCVSCEYGGLMWDCLHVGGVVRACGGVCTIKLGRLSLEENMDITHLWLDRACGLF